MAQRVVTWGRAYCSCPDSGRLLQIYKHTHSLFLLNNVGSKYQKVWHGALKHEIKGRFFTNKIAFQNYANP